jgi:hypothetical protein
MNRQRLSLFAGAWAVTAVLARIAVAQPIVVLEGDTTCPSVDMIHEALRTARPNAPWPKQRVAVAIGDDRLLLSLGEDPVVRREIPADKDCTVRAESIAVVIAAWSGELGARPTDSPVLVTASPAPVLAPVLTPVPTPVKPSSHLVELDASAFYSPLWGHAPGAWLGVGRSPREGGLGARALGAYQSARDVALEGGANQLLRLLLGAALSYGLEGRRVFASGDLGVLGSWTRARGSGYQTTRSGSTFNWGGVADLRAGVRLGRFRLWSDARVVRVASAETVKVDSTSPGIADSAALAAWDVQLGVGVGTRFDWPSN